MHAGWRSGSYTSCNQSPLRFVVLEGLHGIGKRFQPYGLAAHGMMDRPALLGSVSTGCTVCMCHRLRSDGLGVCGGGQVCVLGSANGGCFVGLRRRLESTGLACARRGACACAPVEWPVSVLSVVRELQKAKEWLFDVQLAALSEYRA